MHHSGAGSSVYTISFDLKRRENVILNDLGAKAFSYGYASSVLMAATYNDDGTVKD